MHHYHGLYWFPGLLNVYPGTEAALYRRLRRFVLKDIKWLVVCLRVEMHSLTESEHNQPSGIVKTL